MPKIRIDIEANLFNGQTVTFKAPASCADITGLIIYYPNGNTQASKNFKFVDAHGVDVGSGTMSLFAANAIVKVVLDVDQGKAFIQNADTNAYIEGKFAGSTIVQVSSNKTLDASCAGKFLRIDAPAVIMIPSISTGVEVEVFRNTPGDVTIAPSGVYFAVQGNSSLVTESQTISEQYASVVLKQISINVWSIQGAI